MSSTVESAEGFEILKGWYAGLTVDARPFTGSLPNQIGSS